MDAVRGKFKPLSESEPQPIDISLKHVLIFALILFFIIYILSKAIMVEVLAMTMEM